MALSGTLSDLGIVDLIQFPGTGKKTGELVIAGTEDEARLFYEQGSLKHVTCANATGLDALIELVSWEEGEFEFRLGSTTDTTSIEIDLHRALMVALKTRDERREEARKQAELSQSVSDKTTVVPAKGDMVTRPPSRTLNPEMQSLLSEVASSFTYIEYAAVFHRNGSEVCIWAREDVDTQVYVQIVTSLSDVFGTHPRKELQKVYLTDNLGTCIGFAVGQEYLLFLAAAEESSLGVVSVAASKIANAISGENA
ncbi:MAG: DUF4388 domain-containing protein [Deltaproteobacteria bacterium]|nr:DUF4388 domain-containing protein [Deltaproteobacteria bacterium]